MAVDADGEAARPEQHGGLARDLHDGVQLHVPARGVGEDGAGVVRELHGVEPGREVEQAARCGGLLAGVEARGAQERAPVEDGDVGGAVAHGHHVGVGGVDGEGEADVQRRWRPEVEGGQVHGDELEARVPRPADQHARRGRRGDGAGEGGAPAPLPGGRPRRRGPHG